MNQFPDGMDRPFEKADAMDLILELRARSRYLVVGARFHGNEGAPTTVMVGPMEEILGCVRILSLEADALAKEKLTMSGNGGEDGQ